MNFHDRNALLKERKGLLEDSNLWSFWDGLTDNHQKRIFEYFENTPLMFDYKILFKGNYYNDLYHGMISVLTMIFVNSDLILADSFYAKFIEYNPSNYKLNSNWGINWENAKVKMIQIWQRIVERASEEEIKSKTENLERIKKLSIEDIYWCDAQMFVQMYSVVAYKSFLNNECNIERFQNAFEFSFNNIDRIKMAITNIYGWDKPLRNGIVDQYLIYLEKNKQFDLCLKIIEQVNDKGWSNDFEKRKKRCLSKLGKGK